VIILLMGHGKGGRLPKQRIKINHISHQSEVKGRLKNVRSELAGKKRGDSKFGDHARARRVRTAAMHGAGHSCEQN